MISDINPADAARYQREHQEMIYKTISVLVSRLGGEVVVTRDELNQAPPATLSVNHDNNSAIKIEVEA